MKADPLDAALAEAIAETFLAEEEARRRRTVLERAREALLLAKRAEDDGDWLTTSDVAERYGMKPDTVRYLVREGKIESRDRDPGKRILVSASSLRRYRLLKQNSLAENAM